jgi:hypothetical protein
VAREAEGAFAATVPPYLERTLIDSDLLGRNAYTRLAIAKGLRLTKLDGPGLGVLSATAEMMQGRPSHNVPQAWSKTLWTGFADAHEIAYHARHGDEALCYAVFDRAKGAITEAERRVGPDQD